MPLSTATHTKNKIKYHWRWRSTGVSCNAISTDDIRGGEPVYRIIRDSTHAHESAPRTIDAVKKTAERSTSESHGSTVYGPPNEPKNPRIEGIDFASTSVYAGKIVQAMLAYTPPPDFSQKNAKASHLESWGLSREVADLILNDPNAFLIGSIFDYQIPFRKAWEAPFKLKQRLSHLDVALIASMKFDDLYAAISGGDRGQSLHRFNSVLTNRVISACSHACGKI